MEWCNSNRYNPFNSYKGLTWYESHYKPIAKWFKGEGELPPPIEVSLDCCHDCNFKCPHCNSKKHTNRGKGVMDYTNLFDTVNLVSDWGVRGCCFGGGGEPLMNPVLSKHLFYFNHKMQCAVATNGSLITKAIAMGLRHCKWVAVSIDAGTKETFHKVHGVDAFEKVLSNVKMLVDTKKRTGSKVLISYRFLITPQNWFELPTACKVAKDLGVDAFHARPADLERKDFENIQVSYNSSAVMDAIRSCHTIEDRSFRVYTATHKFDSNFRVFHPFLNCVASPLVLQVCADGNSYVCPDHKLEDRYRLCETKDILEYWGSDKHRDLLQSINVKEECSRCTWTPYAEQIEQLAMGDDPMHLAFP